MATAVCGCLCLPVFLLWVLTILDEGECAGWALLKMNLSSMAWISLLAEMGADDVLNAGFFMNHHCS